MRLQILFLSLITFLLLFGCVPGETTKSEPITMTISHLVKEGNWGCIGEDYKTYFKSDAGKIDYWCGKWGKPGDEISGFWRTGHSEHTKNGFRRFQ